MSMVCEFHQVTKRYGARVVLEDLTIALEAGEIWALTGPSGVGKTTILNLIGLLESPNAGTITLFGQPAPRPGSRAATHLRQMRLGYLFQNFALIDDATVNQNLDVAWVTASRSRHAWRIEKAEALERVGLSRSTVNRRVYTLSGGEQQRVALARLLLKPCELILADEPTGSVDAENRRVIMTLLEQLQEAGKTIVIVTHDPMVAERCTRVISPFPE